MKIRCKLEFVFDSGDQTLEECEAYLDGCTAEVLEWMPDNTGFVLESAEEEES